MIKQYYYDDYKREAEEAKIVRPPRNLFVDCEVQKFEVVSNFPEFSSFTQDVIEEEIDISVPEDPLAIVKNYIFDRIAQPNFFLAEMANLDKTNSSILNNDYVVSKKLDGEHVVCVTLDSTLYVVPRTYDKVDIYHTSLPSGLILDVEKVNDTFVVLDVIANSAGVVRWYPLDKRLERFKLIDDSVKWDVQYYSNVSNLELVENNKPRYKSDGFVFQSRSSPYYFGFNPNMYKWKPGGDTIDLIADVYDGVQCLSALADNGSLYPLEQCADTFHQGMVYEFKIMPDGRLQYVRARDDKFLPNTLAIIAKNRLSVQYSLSCDELKRECNKACQFFNTHVREMNEEIGGAKTIANYLKSQLNDFKAYFTCPRCNVELAYDVMCWKCKKEEQRKLKSRAVKRSYEEYEISDFSEYVESLDDDRGYDADNRYIEKRKEYVEVDNSEQELQDLEDEMMDMSFLDV